jgi:hypothetical protein
MMPQLNSASWEDFNNFKTRGKTPLLGTTAGVGFFILMANPLTDTFVETADVVPLVIQLMTDYLRGKNHKYFRNTECGVGLRKR